MSSPLSGSSLTRISRPAARTIGGAPGTSSKSLPSASRTRPSHASMTPASMADARPPSGPRRFSSETSWSRSSKESSNPATSRLQEAPFEPEDLVQPPQMPLLAGEPGAEKRRDEVERERGADDAGAETEHIHVVVLDRLVRGIRVVADRGTDARELVGRDRDAGAAPADDDSPLGLAVPQRRRDRLRGVGVIDRRCRVGAEIEHFVTLLGEPGRKLVLEKIAGVVGAQDDAHAGCQWCVSTGRVPRTTSFDHGFPAATTARPVVI